MGSITVSEVAEAAGLELFRAAERFINDLRSEGKAVPVLTAAGKTLDNQLKRIRSYATDSQCDPHIAKMQALVDEVQVVIQCPKKEQWSRIQDLIKAAKHLQKELPVPATT